MRKFIVTNGIVETLNLQEDFLKDSFPAAIYAIRQSQSGFFLQKVEDKFEIPGKIYGSTSIRRDKIMRTFARRANTTGVLLTGPKGTGKTLLAKVTANSALEEGYPVIRIQDNWRGEDFNTFIQELGPCVLLFDEFAKIYYNQEEDISYQNELLSLFDGVASSKKLILLTENKYNQIDELYKNRPSRVYYSWQYSGVESEIIAGYCSDNLQDKELIQNIQDIAEQASEFSFDILQSIVEECNANLDTGLSFDEYVGDLNLDITEVLDYVEILSFSGKHRDHETESTLSTNLFELYGDDGFSMGIKAEGGNNTVVYPKLSRANTYKDGVYIWTDFYGLEFTARVVRLPKISYGSFWNSNVF